MTVIHMAPQYLNSNHVTYYVITQVSIRLGLRRTMVRNYYVRRDVDTVSESQIKLPELESKLVVHSSINIPYI